MRTPTSFLVLVLLATTAHAIIIRHDRDSSRYAALAAPYGRVVGTLGEHQKTNCTLVAPRWALGAAHAIEDYYNPAAPPVVEFSGRRYRVDKVIVHPNRIHGAVDSTDDLALLHLSESVEDVPPVLLYGRDDEVGKVATLVGRGQTGTGVSGSSGERGQLLAAHNKVAAALGGSLIFTFDEPPGGEDLEGIGGAGDSGGPALVEQEGKVYLLGVSSFNSGEVAQGTTGRYGTLDGYARVSTHRKWTLETMEADPPSTVAIFGSYRRVPTLTDLPATPAATAVAALLRAFNDQSVEEMAAFYRGFGRHRPEEEIRDQAQGWKESFEQYGRYQLLGYTDAGPYDIALFVRAEKGTSGRALALRLEPQGDHRIKTIVMADVDEPGAQ